MKYVTLLLILFSITSYSQCDNLTDVQYYDNTYSNFSKKHQVSVKFGKSHEISNGYNYVDSSGNDDTMYCIITGFKEPYVVKLYTTLNGGYKTDCTSILSMFRNRYVQGKDSEGRIWKIYKPNTQFYSVNSSNGYQREYNKTKSLINIDGINKTLSTTSNKIDKNRERIYEKLDELNRKTDLLDFQIDKLDNPQNLIKQKNNISYDIRDCLQNTDTGSNNSTLATLSCLNRQLSKLDVLQYEIKKIEITNGSKRTNKNLNSSSYIYITEFDNPLFKISLYTEPNLNSIVRYKCPKKSKVKVIDKGETFYKVIVDGYSGYVSKVWLKRQ